LRGQPFGLGALRVELALHPCDGTLDVLAQVGGAQGCGGRQQLGLHGAGDLRSARGGLGQQHLRLVHEQLPALEQLHRLRQGRDDPVRVGEPAAGRDLAEPGRARQLDHRELRKRRMALRLDGEGAEGGKQLQLGGVGTRVGAQCVGIGVQRRVLPLGRPRHTAKLRADTDKTAR
jgi:hypothetical protein